jgi:hypothetical protein
MSDLMIFIVRAYAKAVPATLNEAPALKLHAWMNREENKWRIAFIIRMR